jgi:hypothetical protein
MSDNPCVDPVIVDAISSASVVPERPRPVRRKTWSAAEGEQEIAARLELLPSGLNFPEDFPEPIHYDVVRRQLVYRGFMSYSSFCFLQKLHADPGYARALDELFTSSIRPPKTPSVSARWIAIITGIVIVFAAMAWKLL